MSSSQSSGGERDQRILHEPDARVADDEPAIEAGRRLAESITERCRGVDDVHNRIVVRKSDDDLSFTSPVLMTS